MRLVGLGEVGGWVRVIEHIRKDKQFPHIGTCALDIIQFKQTTGLLGALRCAPTPITNIKLFHHISR